MAGRWLIFLLRLLAASALCVSPLKSTNAPSRVSVPAFMNLPKQTVEQKAADIKASWQNTFGETDQPQPSEASLLAMAEEALAAEAERDAALAKLEAEIAADDAAAVAYWNAPENVAAREKAAAEKAAKEVQGK